MAKFLHDEPLIGKPLKTLLTSDKVFRTLRGRDDLFRWKQNAGRFSDLTEMVISQQISVKAADAIFKKLKNEMNAPVTAENFLKLKEKQLRAAGLSLQKIDYLMGLAEAVESKTFQISKLKSMNDDDVIAQITSIKGFGVWSAHMYLMFSMARPDVWPVGDLGVQNGAKLYINAPERMTPKELQAWGDRFHGHRTAASLLLWKLKDTASPAKVKKS
jgi:DNA-3-methyladenine glycosylase II